MTRSNTHQLRTPKLARSKRPGWYPYYAGYSEHFVVDLLSHIDISGQGFVVDPWCGSGTTVAASMRHGLTAIGIDANPAMVIVAKGRLLDPSAAGSLPALLNDVLAHARVETTDLMTTEPLLEWFDQAAAFRLRQLERTILRIFVDPGGSRNTEVPVANVSSLAAVFYVALFQVVRSALGPFATSNPTWIRRRRSADALVFLERVALEESYREAMGRLSADIAARRYAHNGTGSIALGSSVDLPLDRGTASAVIGSPPYATRIDYVAATRPELAALGFSWEAMEALRSELIGSPVTRSTVAEADTWGTAAKTFLANVARHPSKASSGYYRRYFAQYFDGLYRSLAEASRVAGGSASLVLVLQPSHYKEQLLDLPLVASEMLAALGWIIVERIDYEQRASKAAINPRARHYRSDFSVGETALIAQQAT